MMKILYFYLSGLLLLWSSCQRPTMLDFALRYAGENRVELEKVLDHYRNDSLKYRAAVFLIGNMPYHYFYTGAQLDSLRQGYRWMQRTGLSAKAVKHKLWKTFGEPDVRRWTKRNDARSVTADFLIRHIDYVFGVWEKRPWASYYSFEDFCEFVLPYRIEREPPGILARGVCTALRTVVRLALCRESGCGVCRFGSERSLTGRAELVCIFRFVVCGIWSLAVTGRTIRRLPGVVGVQCGPVPGIGDPLRNRPGGAESPPDRFAYVDIYGGYRRTKASLPVELL